MSELIEEYTELEKYKREISPNLKEFCQFYDNHSNSETVQQTIRNEEEIDNSELFYMNQNDNRTISSVIDTDSDSDDNSDIDTEDESE